MTVVRDYTFECCWLLLVLIVGIAPRHASAQGLDWDDQIGKCPCIDYYCQVVDDGRRP
jgi:hypothetical protein